MARSSRIQPPGEMTERGFDRPIGLAPTEAIKVTGGYLLLFSSNFSGYSTTLT